MAQIANRTGHAEDGANYTSIAHSYISQWQKLGFAQDASPPHATLSYGMNNTWGLLYNLYSDKELGLDLVPQSVYDIQSAFYPTVFNEYGVVSTSLLCEDDGAAADPSLAAGYSPHLHQR